MQELYSKFRGCVRSGKMEKWKLRAKIRKYRGLVWFSKVVWNKKKFEYNLFLQIKMRSLSCTKRIKSNSRYWKERKWYWKAMNNFVLIKCASGCGKVVRKYTLESGNYISLIGVCEMTIEASLKKKVVSILDYTKGLGCKSFMGCIFILDAFIYCVV